MTLERDDVLCLADSVISALRSDSETAKRLRRVRLSQLDRSRKHVDLNVESQALETLYSQAGVSVQVQYEVVPNIVKLKKRADKLSTQGFDVFIGYESPAEPPHIFHFGGVHEYRVSVKGVGLNGFLIGDSELMIPDEEILDAFYARRTVAVFFAKQTG